MGDLPVPPQLDAEHQFENLFREVEHRYMPDVMSKVRQRAKDLKPEDHDHPRYVDIVRAFESEFSDRHVTDSMPSVAKTTSSLILRENLFLIIVVLMTVSFGFMGLMPYLLNLDPAKIGYKPDVFLDIAKLFAGVVVGGAAGAAASAVASTSRRDKA